MKPIVSVITPCFNQGQYLADLLESVDATCSDPHEVIVVDDGSTEPLTLRCLRRLSARSEKQKLVVITKSNGGLPSARNEALRVAEGEFVQFLDADDLVTKKKLELQIGALRANEGHAVHLSEYVLCDAHRNRFWRPEKSTVTGFEYSVNSFVANWERGLSIPIHCALFRAESIAGIFFDEQLRAKEDWIFWISLALTGAKFLYADFVGAVYRQHNNNMCKNGREMAVSWLRAINHLRSMGIPMSAEAESSLIDHYNNFYVRYFGVVGGTLSGNARNGVSDLNFLLTLVD